MPAVCATLAAALACGLAGHHVAAAMAVLAFAAWGWRQQRAGVEALVEERVAALRHQALHDPLTGLANRALVTEHGQRALARARRAATPATILYIDLDGFKPVNDRLGHAAGDQLLCEVARRLQATVRDGDLVGRLGGDEFVVILEPGRRAETPEALARRIIAAIARPIALAGRDGPSHARVTASVGVASDPAATIDALLADADAALYRAKGLGKNRYATARRRRPAGAADIGERAGTAASRPRR